MTAERQIQENRVVIAGVSLTPREFEVFRLNVLGSSSSEIGQQMGVSMRTVGAHFEKINLKAREGIHCSSRRGKIILAVAAVKQGLIEFPDLPEVQLNDNESRVAALVFKGISFDEMGQRLNIPTRKVDLHMTNAYRKFGIKSERRTHHYLEFVARITYWGLRNGYI